MIFFEAGKKRAGMLSVPFGWKLETAPDVGHSDHDIAAFAVKVLFKEPFGK